MPEYEMTTLSSPRIVAFTTIAHPAFRPDDGREEGPVFPRLVQQAIDEGWQPYGDVFVVQPNAPDLQPCLGIAMIKYSSSEETSDDA